MNQPPVLRVVKLGGSLLRRSDWPTALRRWFGLQRQANHLLVVGGGEWVDRLRVLDQRLNFPGTASHWIAIGFMSVTARWVAARLPDCDLLEEPLTARQARWRTRQERVAVIDPWQWLQGDGFWRAVPQALPASWDVTSDSIAAWLAVGVAADELVLLKSAGSTSDDAEEWARSGLVDAFFPSACAAVPCVRCEPLFGR